MIDYAADRPADDKSHNDPDRPTERAAYGATQDRATDRRRGDTHAVDAPYHFTPGRPWRAL